eukprot:CAMPEP_0181245218 /NCGR_PEP_ID=MMETSP1096-20121128/43298_1 /TAXON_ID=156174 ORGANISM="Chrysochromulina ericina, Strain CCMP281" /NCGR_SAMPLE_ID=MMETSP1096 /ASSEMBLY_ACC=CAM_ASM_000453 /LENGTH=337 /DNA_ID=CAMNT_0023341863 /DNA_START=887 /DNA_END=1901 /DNA_ORIENTATION=+
MTPSAAGELYDCEQFVDWRDSASTSGDASCISSSIIKLQDYCLFVCKLVNTITTERVPLSHASAAHRQQPWSPPAARPSGQLDLPPARSIHPRLPARFMPPPPPVLLAFPLAAHLAPHLAPYLAPHLAPHLAPPLPGRSTCPPPQSIPDFGAPWRMPPRSAPYMVLVRVRLSHGLKRRLTDSAASGYSMSGRAPQRLTQSTGLGMRATLTCCASAIRASDAAGVLSVKAAQREFRHYCRAAGIPRGDCFGRYGPHAESLSFGRMDRALRRMSSPQYVDLAFRCSVAARKARRTGKTARRTLLEADWADNDQMYCLLQRLDVDGDGEISLQDFCDAVL